MARVHLALIGNWSLGAVGLVAQLSCLDCCSYLS